MYNGVTQKKGMVSTFSLTWRFTIMLLYYITQGDPIPVLPFTRSHVVMVPHVTVTHVTVHVTGGVQTSFHSSHFYPSSHSYCSLLSLEYSLLCSFPIIYVGWCCGVVPLYFYVEILRNYYFLLAAALFSLIYLS